MQHHDMSPDLPDKGSAPDRPPAVVIHVRGVHIQIDRLHWPTRWVLTVTAAIAGASAGIWHLLAR